MQAGFNPSPMIHLLPIEPFPERYTEQWYQWWKQDLEEEGAIVNQIDGLPVGSRQGGEFLDPVATWIWKGSQVAAFAQAWQEGEIKEGDWVLSCDGWGPATTAALYMRQCTGLGVKIALFVHAGAHDPADYLARVGCAPWAIPIEYGWFEGVDLILVGSPNHAQMIYDMGVRTPIEVIGYPIKPDMQYFTPWDQRERVVVFPHRIAPEKDPRWFDALRTTHARLYPREAEYTAWVRTRDEYSEETGKAGYYSLLGKSRVVVSAAYQETFGIGVQEAISLGAWAVCPDELSYPDVVREGSGNFYQRDDLITAARLVEGYLRSPHPAKWDGYHENAIRRAYRAITRYQHQSYP